MQENEKTSVIPNMPQAGALQGPEPAGYTIPEDPARADRLRRMVHIQNTVKDRPGGMNSTISAEGVRLLFSEIEYLNTALSIVMRAENLVRDRYRDLNGNYGAACRRVIDSRAANAEMREAYARQADQIRALERAAQEKTISGDPSLLERAEQAEARLAELDTAHAARLEEVLRLRETARRHASEAANARMDAEQAEERGYGFKVRAERAEASLNRLAADFPGKVAPAEDARIPAPNYFRQAGEAGRVFLDSPIFAQMTQEVPGVPDAMFIQRPDDRSVFVEQDGELPEIPEFLMDAMRDLVSARLGITPTDDQIRVGFQLAEVTRRDAGRFWARLDSSEFLGAPEALPGGILPGMTGEETLTLQQGSRILLLGRVTEGEYRPFRTDVEYPFPLESLVKTGLPCFPQADSYIASMRAADRLGLRFVCVGPPQD